MQLTLILLFLTILHNVKKTKTVSFEEDVTINQEQKLILEKFRENVLAILPHEYMSKDIYLIRWLRARNYNLDEAEQMLRDNLAWREENRIDKIHDEDWTDLKRQYKYWIDGVDKEGRPIMFLDVGEWDLRRGVLSGQRQKIVRLIDKVLDEVNVDIRELQSEGKNVTQYYLLIDLGGYNLAQHGCVACPSLVLDLITSYEAHFPGALHKLVIVNTPSIFEPLLQLFRNFANPVTRDLIHFYGKNKNVIKEVLLKDIDQDQLPLEVGGTRILPTL